VAFTCGPRLFVQPAATPAIHVGSFQIAQPLGSSRHPYTQARAYTASRASASSTVATIASLGCLVVFGLSRQRSATSLCGKFAAFSNPSRRDVSQHAAKFTYFSLWAKGPSVALALEHSGMDWEGAFPEDWKSMKATTPFLELPILEVPDVGTIGHELAILNYIGKEYPEMAGSSSKDFIISQQLMNQAEDIYQKLSKLKTGLITGEDADAFWTDENESTHNRNFGVKVFLKLLEAFYTKCGGKAGSFTSSGKTVGECKLFSSLHILKLIKDDILAEYPGLTAFYDRFAAEGATQAVLKGTGRMPGEFGQYFKFC